jgi:hypothetical protein
MGAQLRWQQRQKPCVLHWTGAVSQQVQAMWQQEVAAILALMPTQLSWSAQSAIASQGTLVYLPPSSCVEGAHDKVLQHRVPEEGLEDGAQEPLWANGCAEEGSSEVSQRLGVFAACICLVRR